jgi:MFS family permease
MEKTSIEAAGSALPAASGDKMAAREPIHTMIPARMDALPWSRWHLKVVIALGITWALDGLEVTLAGALGSVLTDPRALNLSPSQVGLSATFYLIGAVLGAIVFGYAADRVGRRKLFFVTLVLYLSATAATAFSWNAASYFVFRALPGAGIGGEYAAINSAIDELIPARLRGQIDLIINSTFWVGATLGACATLFLLDPHRFPVGMGWRFAFGIGAVLGIGILILRNVVPESPRWLMIHGREDEAERIVGEIEQKTGETADSKKRVESRHRVTVIHPRDHTSLKEIARSMLVQHRTRSLLGLTLMIAQAFFCNAIFFTYAIVLGTFYHVPPSRVSLYLIPFAVGNTLGPMVLGSLFDAVGRKPMIVMTYGLSGILLAVTGYLFEHQVLTAATQTVAWSVIFFVASCAASSAYLTVSEIFPLEMRALAIAVFYALGTLVGGVGAPALFGKLIASGSREQLFWGYLLGSALMLIAAGAEAIVGVKAERQSLEDIAAPLSATPNEKSSDPASQPAAA